MFAQREIAGSLSVAGPEALVDVRTVAVIGGDEHLATRLQRHAQRRLERGDVFRCEANGGACVRGTDLVIHRVEDGADHGERLVFQCGEQALSAIRKVALQKEATGSATERGVLVETRLVGLRFVLVPEDRLGHEWIVGQLAQEDGAACVTGDRGQRR